MAVDLDSDAFLLGFSFAVYLIGFPVAYLAVFILYPICLYPTVNNVYAGYAGLLVMLLLLIYSYTLSRCKPTLTRVFYLLGLALLAIPVFFVGSLWITGSLWTTCLALGLPPANFDALRMAHELTVDAFFVFVFVYVFAFGYLAWKAPASLKPRGPQRKQKPADAYK